MLKKCCSLCTLKKFTGFTPLSVVCWEGFPLMNVSKYINTLWTTEHQCRGKWLFYLSKATLKYIEDFISLFRWGGVLFCNRFIMLSKACCVCQIYKRCKLELFVLAETSMSLESACISRWHAHPSFPWWIVMCAYVCMCLIVLRLPDSWQFAPFDKFGHIHLFLWESSW